MCACVSLSPPPPPSGDTPHVAEEQSALLQVVSELKGMLLATPRALVHPPEPPTQPLPPVELLNVSAACPLPPSPPPPQREHTLPEKFSGDLDKSRGFLTQCSLIFRQQTRAYASDIAKITLMVELMTGRALLWAQAVLSCVFDKRSNTDSAAHRMVTLKQGRWSVADFSMDFWILAEETDWEEKALWGAFLNSLNENVKRELATKELPKSLSALVNMCISLDDHMQEFGRRTGDGRRSVGGVVPTGLPSLEWREEGPDSPADEEQPMQLGRTKFTRSRRQLVGECFVCGKKGHFEDAYPLRLKDSAPATLNYGFFPAPILVMH
uniref:DUF4939 domain-containing protein n=1 Tax=Pundamilia nyererei TaxID=303518 RepID=A0A3B4G8L9_9CICH